MAGRLIKMPLGLTGWLLLFGMLSLSFASAASASSEDTSDAVRTTAEVNAFLELVFQSKEIDIYAGPQASSVNEARSQRNSISIESLHSIADEYWSADDYDNLQLAASNLKSAAAARGDASHVAIADAYLAYATGGLGDYGAAAEQLEQVMVQAARLEDKSAYIIATILQATLQPYEAKFLQAKAEVLGIVHLLDQSDEPQRLKPAISCSLGYLAIELGEIEDAIHQYTSCISEARAEGLRIDLGTLIFNMAMVLAEKNLIEASDTAFESLINWYDESGQPENKLYAYYGLAYNAYDLGDYTKSLEYVRAGIAISEDLDDFSVFLYQVGAIDAARLGDLKSAQQYLKIAKSYFASRPEYQGTSWEIRNQLAEAEIAFASGRTREAYQLLKAYYNAREEVLSSQSQHDVDDWRNQTEEAYQRIVADQESKLEQQNIIQKLQGGLILCGLCAMAILLFGFMKLRQNTAQLIESDARFDRAMSNSKSGIWEIDLVDNSRYYSPSFEALFGYAPNELVSLDDWMSVVFPPQSRQVIADKLIEHKETKDYFNFDVLAVCKNKKEIWINIEGSVLRDNDGRMKTLSGVSTDITDRKTAENLLLEAKTEADRLSRAKSEFIASMSHELRTPLNSVIGFSEVLRMDAINPLEPRQKECLGYIESAGKHLLNIVNGIINISRIELGDVEFDAETLDLSEVVKECCAMVMPMQKECAAEVVFVPPEHEKVLVRGDRQWISQIALNLLSNALKYNTLNGKVTVEIEDGGPQACRLCVSDTGIGIDEVKQQHLFELFNRLGVEQVSSASGSGIGLAVSRRMAEAMGGSIGFKSAVGEGSCFWLQLPLAEATGLGAKETASNAAA